MSKTYQYCNNCGKQGHVFNQCKIPISSNGVIAFRKRKDTNEIEYLMICRKDSLGYIDFLRGKYPLYNKEYILTLIDEMTVLEKQNLLNMEFDELWNNLWGDFIGLQYRTEEKMAKDKFIQILRGIKNCDIDSYNLETLIKESDTSWELPEWGFPKGRRNYQESDLVCGLREFEEETGYNRNYVNIIKNIMPYEEIFIGSNLKSYKHVYFLGFLDNNIMPDTPFDKSEVSQMRWFNLEECKNQIRTYNLEKKEMISKIDNFLERYRLISS